MMVAGIGYYLFEFGKLLVRQTGAHPKLNAIGVALGCAVVLAIVAAGPREIREGGDGLFDGGEVVASTENPHPLQSAVRVGLFTFVCIALGIRKAK